MPQLTITPQPTPNPNAYKFVANRTLHQGNALTFYNAAAAREHDLARRLFAITGVTGVMILNNFCSVNKEASASWDEVIPEVVQVLSEAYEARESNDE